MVEARVDDERRGDEFAVFLALELEFLVFGYDDAVDFAVLFEQATYRVFVPCCGVAVAGEADLDGAVDFRGLAWFGGLWLGALDWRGGGSFFVLARLVFAVLRLFAPPFAVLGQALDLLLPALGLAHVGGSLPLQARAKVCAFPLPLLQLLLHLAPVAAQELILECFLAPPCARAVVFALELGVDENVARPAQVDEPVGGIFVVRVLVGVVADRGFAVGALDCRLFGVEGDAEELVVVLSGAAGEVFEVLVGVAHGGGECRCDAPCVAAVCGRRRRGDWLRASRLKAEATRQGSETIHSGSATSAR